MEPKASYRAAVSVITILLLSTLALSLVAVSNCSYAIRDSYVVIGPDLSFTPCVPAPNDPTCVGVTEHYGFFQWGVELFDETQIITCQRYGSAVPGISPEITGKEFFWDASWRVGLAFGIMSIIFGFAALIPFFIMLATKPEKRDMLLMFTSLGITVAFIFWGKYLLVCCLLSLYDRCLN
jgi:hypothetical protein